MIIVMYTADRMTLEDTITESLKSKLIGCQTLRKIRRLSAVAGYSAYQLVIAVAKCPEPGEGTFLATSKILLLKQ